MNQLNLIMVQRVACINSFKTKISASATLNTTQLQELFHQLLAQKKKYHSNQSSEIKISRTLIAQKIQSPYKLMQLYQSSKNIMKSYSPDFLSQSDSQQIERVLAKNKNQQQQQTEDLLINHNNLSQNGFFKHERHLSSNVHSKKKVIQKIINLYYEFFMDQNSSSKAQEIMHIYNKKICEQSQIPPTLFCWLNDWIGKEFMNFIKTQISILNQNKNDDKEKSKKQDIQQYGNEKGKTGKDELKQSVLKDTSKRKYRKLSKPNQVDMFFSINLASIQDQKNNISSMDHYHQHNLNEGDLLLMKDRKDFHHRGRSNEFLTIAQSKEISQKMTQNSNSRGKRYYSSMTSNQMTQKGQKNDELIVKETIINEGESYPINREVFIGAYYDRFSVLYKNLQNVIPDLDTFYIKQIKRNDRKAELRKRLSEVNKMFIRIQPIIKNSIDEYNTYYRQKTSRLKKHHSKKHKTTEIKENNPQENNQIPSLENIQPKVYQNFSFSFNPQRKLPSKLSDRSQSQLLMKGLGQPISKNIQEKTKEKETLTINRPMQFSFNLPKIPDHQKGIQLKPKQLSKVVLIQTGRYKFLDPSHLPKTLELSKRKNKNNDLSMYISQIKHKNNSLIFENQRPNSKSSCQTNERSLSILQMITKKKKESSNREKKFSLHQEGKKKSKRQKQDEKSPKRQIVNFIENLEENDLYPLSGWEKGQETPVTS